MARPARKIEVSDEDRAELESWLRASNTKRSLADRARMILLSAEGLGGPEIAGRVGTTPKTVFRWRSRYLAEGVAGLRDRPRAGQPRKLSEARAKEILRLTVETIPREATHWSLRLMARRVGVSVHHVAEVWRAAGLKPHRLRTFKISRDPDFADKVVDIVGLYMNPPDDALVLCVDEKTQVQALDRTQPMLPLRPGQVARRTHDYKRHGTASLYAAFDIASGEVMGRVTKRHRAKEFLDFLRQIDRGTPPELDLHVVLDNSSTHKTPEVESWLARRPRFHLHFTPTSASWLNAVEGWFSRLERRAIRRGSFTSVRELRDAIRGHIAVHNDRLAKPLQWTQSANAILTKVERAKCAVVQNTTKQTGH